MQSNDSLENRIWNCVKGVVSGVAIVVVLSSPFYASSCKKSEESKGKSGFSLNIFKDKYDLSTPEGAIKAWYKSMENKDVDLLMKVAGYEDDIIKDERARNFWKGHLNGDGLKSFQQRELDGKDFNECYVKLLEQRYVEDMGGNDKYKRKVQFKYGIFEKDTNVQIGGGYFNFRETQQGEWHIK